MRALKKDVIRELKGRKESDIYPVVLDSIKKAKNDKQIAFILFKFYLSDIFAICFDTSEFPTYWKEWAISDYLKAIKHIKHFDSKSTEKTLKKAVDKNIVNLYDLDLSIRDMFQNMSAITEKSQEYLDSREALHIRMIGFIYDTVKARRDALQKEIEKIDNFIKAE